MLKYQLAGERTGKFLDILPPPPPPPLNS